MDRAQLKQRAYKEFHAALKEGRITRQPCVICGSARSHGHHPNYRYPLEVHWLCQHHHFRVHTVLNRRARPRVVAQFITYNRETFTIEEWAARIGVAPTAITARLRSRWPLGLALLLKPCRPRDFLRHGRMVRAARECLAYLRPPASKREAAQADGPQLLLGV